MAWKPFFLRPDMPVDGKPKGGDPMTRVPQRLKQVGATVGIDFSGLTDRYPNSTKAHTLLTFAQKHAGQSVQNKLQEILFRHYFTDGKYPDEGNLREAAIEAGLDVERAMDSVKDPAQHNEIRQEALANSRSGITGVPFFFINGQPFGSGAHPPEAFVSAFEKLA